jgi:hypothetical protein
MKIIGLAATALALTFASSALATGPIAYKVRTQIDADLTEANFYDPGCSEEESGECAAFILSCEDSAMHIEVPGLMENALAYAREGKTSIAVDGKKTKLAALEASIDELNGGWILTIYSGDTRPLEALASGKRATIDIGVPIEVELTDAARAAGKAILTACKT